MDIENSSRGFLTVFFRQGNAFVVISVLIVLAGLGYLVITKPVYESSGSLVVKFSQSTNADGSPGGEVDANTRQEIIKSYINIIGSRDFLRERINAFGVYLLYPELRDKIPENTTPEEAAVQSLLENDLALVNDQSRMIDISVRNGDPEVAAKFAAQIMDAFIHRRSEIYNIPRADILQKQTEDARTKLEKSRNDYQDFKGKTGISGIDEEVAQLLREKSELNALAYTAVTQAQAKLSDLEAQEAKMRTTYRPESSLLGGLLRTIESARSDLLQRQNDLNANGDSKNNSLSSRLATINKRLAYLESQRGAYNELQQQVKIREENYLNYLKRSEDARISNLLNSENVTHIGIVDNPVADSDPVRPQKKIFLAVILMAALMAGFGAALSRELLDDRLTNPEQVLSSIGVPVLAVYRKEIPYDSK